jgi:formylglycine-generating enzyme
MQEYRSFHCVGVVILVLCCDSGLADDGLKQLGIMAQPIQGVACVAIDGGKGGYMVPYTHPLGETGIAFDMVPIPGGKVRVGSPKTEHGRSNDEGPCFEVDLQPYWIGKTEVTWREYQCFMRIHFHFARLAKAQVSEMVPLGHPDAITIPTILYDPLHHREFTPSDDHPAVTMTQYAAKQYTKWLSKITRHQYRLPTEAEWEHAARAGTQSAYCFGDDPADLDQYAVYDGPLKNTTGASAVASKKPNAFGIHDMHGNVWEWTIEHYSEKGYEIQNEQKFIGLEGTQWPTKIDSQCVRGGCWADPPLRLRSASRMGSKKDEWAQDDPEIPTSPWWYTSDPSRMVGMRIVRSLEPVDDRLIPLFWEIELESLQDDVNESIQIGRGKMGLASPRMLSSLKRDLRKK